MRRWQRTFLEERCGRCGKAIPKGDPMLVIVGDGKTMTWRKLRCRDCAGEPVPEEMQTKADA